MDSHKVDQAGVLKAGRSFAGPVQMWKIYQRGLVQYEKEVLYAVSYFCSSTGKSLSGVVEISLSILKNH